MQKSTIHWNWWDNSLVAPRVLLLFSYFNETLITWVNPVRLGHDLISVIRFCLASVSESCKLRGESLWEGPERERAGEQVFRSLMVMAWGRLSSHACSCHCLPGNSLTESWFEREGMSVCIGTALIVGRKTRTQGWNSQLKRAPSQLSALLLRQLKGRSSLDAGTPDTSFFSWTKVAKEFCFMQLMLKSSSCKLPQQKHLSSNDLSHTVTEHKPW